MIWGKFTHFLKININTPKCHTLKTAVYSKFHFLRHLSFQIQNSPSSLNCILQALKKKQRMKRTNPVRGLNNPDIVKNTLLLVLLDQLERICTKFEPNFYPVLVPPQDNLLHPQLQQQAFKFKSIFCENSFEIQLGRTSKSSTYLPQ